MRYTIRIKRQENKEAKPFWQEFEIEAEGELSIAAMLNELNARQKLTDKSGKYMTEYTHEIRYQSARCLMCGCCLEVCPNFDFGKDFAGAIAPVNAYRILNEEQDTSHHEQIAEKYRKHYFEGCGKSLSCQNICPAGIPVEELMVRSNAAAVWKK